MSNDNTTPMNAKEYDAKINDTIPYYSEFYDQTLSVVNQKNFSAIRWLDLGCGTGELERKAAKMFPDIQFVMVDPSKEMLEQAKEKNMNIQGRYLCAGSDSIEFSDEFEAVTAIESHHYMKPEEREKATHNVYRALHKSGIYITFENVIPEALEVKEFELQRWGKYQLEHGKSEKEVKAHIARCGVSYFPLTINQHINLLKSCGFTDVHVFWYSYMQMGVYAIR